MDFEIDYTAVAVTIILAFVFIVPMWKFDFWGDYPMKWKIAITVFYFPCAYFVALLSLEK